MKKLSRRMLAVIMVMMVFFTSAAITPDALSVSVGKTTGKIKVSSTYMRKAASGKSKKVKKLKRNTKVVIQKEVFTSKTKTNAKSKWYLVKAKGKTGYVRADKVKSIKYKTTVGQTTAELNYRSGPSTSMKIKGTFKPGATVNVVMTAYAKGGSTAWYKIKQGGAYSYVSAKYVGPNGSYKPAAEPAAAAPAAPLKLPAASPNPLPVIKQNVNSQETFGDIVFTNTNMTYPVTIYTYVPFSLKGNVACTQPIESITVGIAGQNGNWVSKSDKQVNATSFDIAIADSEIKFKTIPAGKYTYKVIARVGGKDYTAFSSAFDMCKSTGGTKINNMAFAIAWPIGTPASTYAFKGGAATREFNYVFDRVYPTHYKWGKGPRVGACCDVYVGTTVRACGYDPDMPRGETEMWAYLPTSPKWAQVAYTGSESELRPGDVILYKRTDGGQHVLIYVQKGGKGYLAEASYEKTYGHINTSISKIQKWSNKTKMVVFRATS